MDSLKTQANGVSFAVIACRRYSLDETGFCRSESKGRGDYQVEQEWMDGCAARKSNFPGFSLKPDQRGRLGSSTD